MCRTCRASRESKRIKDVRYDANWSLKKRYGQTLAGKESLLKTQNGICANPACGHKFESCSDAQQDHNHATKKLRGLLCGRCNRALGLLDDSLDKILGLVVYLRKYV